MGLSKLLDIKKCSNCNCDVEIRHKSRLQRTNIYCCKKCESEHRKKNNPNYFPCVVCGKVVYRKPKYIKENNINNIFCSYNCMSVYRKQNMIGENNPNYGKSKIKNGDIMYKNDYIYERCINHPFSDCDGWVRQHRLVAEKYLLNKNNSVEINGKNYLSPNYEVHHIDFNKYNNNQNNLMILTKSEHQQLHQKIKKENKTY